VTRRLFIEELPGELRAALVDGHDLREFRLARKVGGSQVGEVHLGRVVRILPALQAALIEIGLDRPAYLAAVDVVPKNGLAALHEGAAALVQVKRDARADKAAGVTMRVRLAGRLCDWTPMREAVNVEAISGPERRRVAAALGELLRPGEGVQVLPVAAFASPQALAEAVNGLRARWGPIDDQRRTASPPCCLFAMAPVAALLEQLAEDELEAIIVDDDALFAEIRAWLARERPALVARLGRHRAATPLFEAEGIADRVAALFELKVNLPSGGAVIFEPTSTAALIDVDSGVLVEERRLGDEALLVVDLEAAQAIAREIRLRGLAGAFVVDFIALRGREHRMRLLEAFRSALHSEVPEAQLLGWTKLGHVELTRPRWRAPLHEILFERTRQGGFVKTPLTVALEALAAAAREAASSPARALRLRLSPEVASQLAAGDAASARTALEGRIGRTIEVVAEPGRARESFDIGSA